MYKKTISGLSIIAAAFGLAAFSAPASATCGTDNPGVWDCLSVNGNDVTDQGFQGPLTYSGQASLTHWAVGTLTCDLAATGEAEVVSGTNPVTDPGSATIRVTALVSGGSTSCGRISFELLPLVFDDATPVSADGSDSTSDTSNGKLNIDHAWWPNICEDYIHLTFKNDGYGGSSFSFSQTIAGYLGDCSINGTLTNNNVEAY